MTYLLNNSDKKISLDRHSITYVCSLNSVFVHWEQQEMIDVTNISDELFNSFVDNYYN